MSHVYVHVPFCARRCSYCDFAIAVRRSVPSAEYLEAVTREAETAVGREPIATLYFGGGTPSLLDTGAFADLIRRLTALAPLAPGAEVTIEANPEDVTAASARAWRAAGVNRVSLGAQSFDDRVLRWMHRIHDAERTRDAVRALRDAGFDDLSLDLIFAVPPELGRDFSADLDAAVALSPDHLSLYGLTVEERTPLARWISRGESHPPDDDRYAAEYLEAHRRLAAAGYRFYEVSNAARDGRRSRHNSAYWTGASYAGLGPAAHSFDGATRRWNHREWERYRRAIVAGESPVESVEALTGEQAALERAYLDLRTDRGISRSILPAVQLSTWLAQDWVEARGDRVVCRPEGWLRLDALVSALTAPPAAR
ncbi:MAG TPA: radical SAM family heme chaperone HemW [Gemmatimonadales bacterium]|nr:radical SAM family heme chaperone HemW [Gemmatimonadales bacterium]